MRKTRLLALGCCVFVCMCIFADRCCAQAGAEQFANSFASLGSARVDNALMITVPLAPKLVVLTARGPHEEIYLFSLTKEQPRVIWHLSQFPPSVESISPRNLQIRYTDDGPVITLHGCARHLCGGKGSAGAFTYSVASGRMCSALASWDDRANRADFSYSCPGGTVTDSEKGFLDGMLREEGY